MSNIFGSIRLSDTDYVFNGTIGQRVIWDEVAKYVAEQNAAINAVLGAFVEETTEDHSRRYKLPGGGMLQKAGGQAQSAATKRYGQWDVAFPIEQYGDQVAQDYVTGAYMTAGELSRNIETVTIRNINTVRYELLKRLFTNTATTFVDPLWGSLTVQPLANGDSVVYPPVIGSADEATETHYIASGYATAAISNTNDPIGNTIVPELEEHFGQVTGGSPIVVFVNAAEVAKLTALAAVNRVQDNYVTPGSQTAIPGLPPALPGRTIGRHDAGAWIQQWDWIPAGYTLSIHLDQPRPLIKRRDPAATGLPDGLALIAQEAEHPFNTAHWHHRFGFGVGNRLNGVVVQLTAAAYSIPTAYA